MGEVVIALILTLNSDMARLIDPFLNPIEDD